MKVRVTKIAVEGTVLLMDDDGVITGEIPLSTFYYEKDFNNTLHNVAAQLISQLAPQEPAPVPVRTTPPPKAPQRNKNNKKQ